MRFSFSLCALSLFSVARMLMVEYAAIRNGIKGEFECLAMGVSVGRLPGRRRRWGQSLFSTVERVPAGGRPPLSAAFPSAALHCAKGPVLASAKEACPHRCLTVRLANPVVTCDFCRRLLRGVQKMSK